jgi:hypothetical protein
MKNVLKFVAIAIVLGLAIKVVANLGARDRISEHSPSSSTR